MINTAEPHGVQLRNLKKIRNSKNPRKTRLDTEVTKASRRGTEFCIGENATAAIIWQTNPVSPRSDFQAFLRELLFVLCDLCDEIGLRNLGQLETTAIVPSVFGSFGGARTYRRRRSSASQRVRLRLHPRSTVKKQKPRGRDRHAGRKMLSEKTSAGRRRRGIRPWPARTWRRGSSRGWRRSGG